MTDQAAPPVDAPTHRCAWCGAAVSYLATECPACRTPLIADRSRWLSTSLPDVAVCCLVLSAGLCFFLGLAVMAVSSSAATGFAALASSFFMSSLLLGAAAVVSILDRKSS